jgi:anti-sigma B factor antagonist
MQAAHHRRADHRRTVTRPLTATQDPAQAFTAVIHLDAVNPTVQLTGELDLANVNAADSRLREAWRSASVVILDLRAVSFIDCSGLKLVIDADTRMRHTGGRLMIVRGPAQVQRLFELTGITDQFEIIADPPPITLHAARHEPVPDGSLRPTAA